MDENLYKLNCVTDNKDFIIKIIKKFIPKLEENNTFKFTANSNGDEDLYVTYNGKSLFFRVSCRSGEIILYDLNHAVNYKEKHKYHKQKNFRSWVNAISYLKTLHLPRNMNKKKKTSSIDRMFNKLDKYRKEDK